MAPETLRRYLAQKFDAYLREGWLTIEIVAGMEVRLDLYFDPSGKGRVAIRHEGVVVVEDLSAMNSPNLALAGGLSKKRAGSAEAKPRQARTGRAARNGDPPRASGNQPAARGGRIRYEELPFENNSTAHSRFISGVVQANTLHPDYIQTARSWESRLAYAALMIGKETIAFNDRSGMAGDFLENSSAFTSSFKRGHDRGEKGRFSKPRFNRSKSASTYNPEP